MKKITLVLVIVLFSITVSYNVFAQTTSDAPYDDGDLKTSAVWPDPRFTEDGDGPVIDNYTDFMWLQKVQQGGSLSWYDAIIYLDDFELFGFDDWQLTNVVELINSVDHETYLLSMGDPYYYHRSYYWHDGEAYAFDKNGVFRFFCYGKTSTKYIWHVRDGN